jgi:hypothetical protein
LPLEGWTVNPLADTIGKRALRESWRIRLGAVGLGSSNDFHKPIRDDRRLRASIRLV